MGFFFFRTGRLATINLCHAVKVMNKQILHAFFYFYMAIS